MSETFKTPKRITLTKGAKTIKELKYALSQFKDDAKINPVHVFKVLASNGSLKAAIISQVVKA